MKTLKRIAGCLLLLCLGMAAGHAQTGKSVYGDQVKADVRLGSALPRHEQVCL